MTTPNDPYHPDNYTHEPWVGYTVLSGGHHNLGEQVRRHMEIGWLPQGGVTLFGEPGQAIMYQAMYNPNWRGGSDTRATDPNLDQDYPTP